MTPHRLLFDPVHIGPILDGDKWRTLRYGLDADISPGDSLKLADSETGEVFARSTTSTVSQVDPRWFVGADLDGHRSYRTVGQLCDELSGYYPDATILPDTPLEMIDWRDTTRSPSYLREPLREDPRGGRHD